MGEFSLNNLKSINNDTRSWNAKVTILCMKPPKLAKNSPVRFQKLVFVDELGDCIDAVMFDSEIEKYKDIMMQDRTYIISNATVALAGVNYKSAFSNNDYSWTITKFTLVSETEQNARHGNPFRGHFTEYSDLKIGSLISMIVVVISAQAPRQVPTGQTVTEYVVVDKHFNEIIVSLWEDATTDHTHSLLQSGSYPVVALINYNVKEYHGLSLSSSSSSCLITKMDNPSFVEMEDWRAINKEKIESIITKGHAQGLKFAAVSNQNLPEVNISQLLESEPKKKYNITVRAGIENTPTNFLYTCCNVCHTKTSNSFGELFMCMGSRCKTNRLVVRRFVFTIQLEDPTGKIDVTLFGEMGEKILKMNENDFYDRYNPDWNIPKEDINSRLQGLTWKMRILKNISTYRGNATVSYILDDMVRLNDHASNEDTPTQIVFAAKEKATGMSPQHVTSSTCPSSSVELPRKETLSDILLTKDIEESVTITKHTITETSHHVSTSEGLSSETELTNKGGPSNEVKTKRKGRPPGSCKKHTKGTSSDFVMKEGMKKRGRPRGSRNKTTKGNTANTSTDVSYNHPPKTNKAPTDVEHTQKETASDVISNEAPITASANYNTRSRNNILDPNIKVKIEEVEDAKRDAAFRSRTNPSTWDKNEIINLDLDVQVPDCTPTVTDTRKITIENKVPSKRGSGRLRGSCAKRTKTSR